MNYHVKSISSDGRKANVVFHIPIPDEQNSASFSLRTAVSQYKGGTSQVPWITGAELTQLGTGELYEHFEMVVFEGGASNLEKQTTIDNRYTTLSTTVLDRIRTVLKFWGKDRNI